MPALTAGLTCLAVLLLGTGPRHAARAAGSAPAGPTAGPARIVRSGRPRRRAPRAIPSAVAVAEWCTDLARRLRAGATLHDALVATPTADASLATVIDTVRHHLARGHTVREATERIDPAHGPHVSLAAGVLCAAGRFGGPAGAALDRAAAALRLRALDHHDRLAQSAQARLSAAVLTVVPAGFLGLLLALDADVRAVVVSAPGAACVAAGATLDALGWLWMRRTIGAP